MSLKTLMAEALPLNRKEKYYTGTVFPGIVCANDFAHFNLFARLLPGSPQFSVDPNPASTNIQFFTEYSPLHSFVGAAKARMLEIPASNETPDVVVVIKGKTETALIVLEAKVFDSTNGAELTAQLQKQQPFIDCVRSSIGVDRVYHAALIPSMLRQSFTTFRFPVVTWDDLYREYHAVIPTNYFVHVLGYALEHFDSLRSTSAQSRGANADARMTGADIKRRFDDGSLEFSTMGRNGGLRGPELRRDVESGRWRTTTYEVRFDGDPINRNWFPVADFVEMLTSAPQPDPGGHLKLPTKGKLAGAEILRQYERGTLWYKTVGRNRGLHGPEFQEDVRTGRWTRHNYEVSTAEEPENRNWFTVQDFARAIGAEKGV